MAETILANARVVLADEVIENGHVVVRDGHIAAIGNDAVSTPHQDCAGDYLIPGLVELHTDHLESHYMPRPGVHWPTVSAVIAHDAQIAAAGITTVCDALRAGTFEGRGGASTDSATHVLAAAIDEARAKGLLRVDHLIHLRCELPCPDTAEVTEAMLEHKALALISVMDHTPGERQFVTVEKFREYYLGKKLMSSAQLDVFIDERRAMRDRWSDQNRAAITAMARTHGKRLASHDDATEAHVAEALRDGAVIAEFPTTAQSAKAAHEAGLSVLMGAPNLVRGGSHSGNISTAEVAANGHLDIMSSDYVPASLLLAAFAMPQQAANISLPAALRTVTRNPARAIGLEDRGEIKMGLRGDLAQLRLHETGVLVRKVWRLGERVV